MKRKGFFAVCLLLVVSMSVTASRPVFTSFTFQCSSDYMNVAATVNVLNAAYYMEIRDENGLPIIRATAEANHGNVQWGPYFAQFKQSQYTAIASEAKNGDRFYGAAIAYCEVP